MACEVSIDPREIASESFTGAPSGIRPHFTPKEAKNRWRERKRAYLSQTGISDNFAGASPFRAHSPLPESALPPSSQAQLPISTLGGGAVYMSAAIGGNVVVSQMHFSGSTLWTPI